MLIRVVLLIFLAAVRGTSAESGIVELAARYLSAEGADKEEAAVLVSKYSGSIAEVIRRLEKQEPKNHVPASGAIVGQHFTAPDLRRQHPNDLLHFLIPSAYTPTRPIGLLIFMHGGGPGTTREYARSVISDPATDRYSYGMREHFTNSQFIVVAPSAPWNEQSSARWNLPEADEYISSVIRECRYRFNIDRDHVFLGGHSMGGFGAYHLCQRLADRIAGGVFYAGAWRTARWGNMVGTPLFIRHGTNDAVPPGTTGKTARPRYTDVFYASAASRLLTMAGADHVYAEDEGGHSIRAAGVSLRQLEIWMRDQRRNPFAPEVIALSPRGWNALRDTPTPHHRWVTIHEIGDGALPFDEVQRTGPGPGWKESRASFLQQGFKLTRRNARAGQVEATNHGDNRLTVDTENVKRLSLWFHPQMLDFAKPLQIKLNGKSTRHRLKPSLLSSLRSFERRGDWGLIYHAELALMDDR
jgi:predicted esterase